MSMLEWALSGLGVLVLMWLLGVLGLVAVGRREDAAAVARFIPDCVVLLRRLLGDGRVPLARKLVLAGLLGYLIMPVDLVPDLIPIAGMLDDAIVAALALRLALRAGGPDLLREHWPGPARSRKVVLRLAYGAAG